MEKELLMPLDLQLFAEDEFSEEELKKYINGTKSLEDELKSLHQDNSTAESEESNEEEEEESETNDVETEENETEEDSQNEDDSQVSEETKAETKPTQSRNENSKYARERREREQREREEAIRKQAYEEGLKKGRLENQKINEFTGEKIEDESDLEIYQLQKSIKEKGGDPIKDLAKELASVKRAEREKASTLKRQQSEAQERANKEVRELMDAYPTLTKEDVNQIILRYSSEGKLGKVPLKYLYIEDMYKRGNTTPKPKSNRQPSSHSSGQSSQEYNDDDLLDPTKLDKKAIEAFQKKYGKHF